MTLQELLDTLLMATPNIFSTNNRAIDDGDGLINMIHILVSLPKTKMRLLTNIHTQFKLF